MLFDRHAEAEEFQNFFQYDFRFSSHLLVYSRGLIVGSPVGAGSLPVLTHSTIQRFNALTPHYFLFFWGGVNTGALGAVGPTGGVGSGVFVRVNLVWAIVQMLLTVQ